MRTDIHTNGVGMRSSSMMPAGRSPSQSLCATRYQPPTLPTVRDDRLAATLEKASTNWTLYQWPSIGGIQSTNGCCRSSSHADERSSSGSGVASQVDSCVGSRPPRPCAIRPRRLAMSLESPCACR